MTSHLSMFHCVGLTGFKQPTIHQKENVRQAEWVQSCWDLFQELGEMRETGSASPGSCHSGTHGLLSLLNSMAHRACRHQALMCRSVLHGLLSILDFLGCSKAVLASTKP